MKSRGLVVVVAGLLAILATAAVFLYVRGVKQDAKTGGGDVSVIVAKRDIAAGTKLDDLVSQGAFAAQLVSSDEVVRDAVTSLDQLRGRTTAFPIIEGQQMTTASLQGSETQAEGGALGIPAGYEAVTVPLPSPQAIGGHLQQGDHVTIFATFDDMQVIRGLNNIDDILKGKAPVDNTSQNIGSFTLVVAPDVEVLKVDGASTTGSANAQSQVFVTLALTAQDAQRVVFAQEKGSVWLSLLPPNQKGVAATPINGFDLLGNLVKS